MGELEGAAWEQLEPGFWVSLSGLEHSGYTAGVCFGLCLSDAAGYLCQFNLQGKSLSYCCLGEDMFAFASSKEWALRCLSLCSLKLQGIERDSWRLFWLSIGADVLLKFKCFWSLIPRFTELIREKTSNGFGNLLEPVYNKVVAGRM